MGHAGGAAWPGEAEGHWSVQLYSGSHERTNAELQSPPCSSTGTVQEFEWRTGKDISSCLKSHGFFCVLQVEFHPRLCQAELKSVCEEYGVCFQAYSSLGQGDLVTDPVVLEVAKQCQRTPAQVSPLALLSWVYLCFYCKHFRFFCPSPQVLLRWAVQQGVAVLPKSSNADRIQENARLFDFTLSDADMDRLSALDCGQKYCWDPSGVA